MHETQQVQVQWGDGSTAFKTWENAKEFLKAYPYFNLGDKVSFKVKGNVRKENRKQNDERADDVEEEVNNNTPQLDMRTVPNSVSLEGHIEQDQCIKGPRRSNRQPTTNVQLRNYVCRHYVSITFLSLLFWLLRENLFIFFYTEIPISWFQEIKLSREEPSLYSLQ